MVKVVKASRSRFEFCPVGIQCRNVCAKFQTAEGEVHVRRPWREELRPHDHSLAVVARNRAAPANKRFLSLRYVPCHIYGMLLYGTSGSAKAIYAPPQRMTVAASQ